MSTCHWHWHWSYPFCHHSSSADLPAHLCPTLRETAAMMGLCLGTTTDPIVLLISTLTHTSQKIDLISPKTNWLALAWQNKYLKTRGRSKKIVTQCLQCQTSQSHFWSSHPLLPWRFPGISNDLTSTTSCHDGVMFGKNDWSFHFSYKKLLQFWLTGTKAQEDFNPVCQNVPSIYL